jgi:hypothetical protein
MFFIKAFSSCEPFDSDMCRKDGPSPPLSEVIGGRTEKMSLDGCSHQIWLQQLRLQAAKARRKVNQIFD